MLRNILILPLFVLLAAEAPRADYVYIDIGGIVRTERFKNASEFVREGIALVEKGGVKYFLDENLTLRAFPPGTRRASRTPAQGRISFDLNDGLCGWVNLQGAVVIPARFSACGSFSGGTTYAREPGGKIGFIDTTGSWIVKPRYESFRGFSMDRMPVQIDGKWGVVDRDFKLVIPTVYDRTMDYSEGFLPVKKGDAWGYLALDGSVAIPFDSTLDFAHPFYEGRAMVEVKTPKGTLRTYIDPSGKRITEPRFSRTTPFRDGLAWVRDEPKGKWGLLKADGGYAIAPRYEEEPRQYGGLQVTWEDDRYRFHDEAGVEALKAWRITKVWGFTEGIFTVHYVDTAGDTRYAWITPAGKKLRDLPGPPHILSVGEFVHGLAPVEVGPQLQTRIGFRLPRAYAPVIETAAPQAASGKGGARSRYLVYNLWKRSINISGAGDSYILRYALVEGHGSLGLRQAEGFIQRAHMGLSYSLIRRDLVPFPAQGAEAYLLKEIGVGRYSQIKDSEIQLRNEGQYQF